MEHVLASLGVPTQGSSGAETTVGISDVAESFNVPRESTSEPVATTSSATSALSSSDGASQVLEATLGKAKAYLLFVKGKPGSAESTQTSILQSVLPESASILSLNVPQVHVTDSQATVSEIRVLSTMECEHQEVQVKAPVEKLVTMQLETKWMLNMIPNEIRALKASQASKVAALHARLSKLEETMAQLPERLKEAEARVSQLEDQVSLIKKPVTQFKKQNSALEAKLEELENHSCCSNGIVGVPEGCEGHHVLQWVDSFIKS
ncbi:hypothetical protein NDU88_001239 [Pleurodeles waltl]|uniref:Uncharacterized protein n=1 Tax=Pleurodeles waltl TaxID=8319 RepID=A0AAV7P6F0_PLEWA|nr:hypothetical protein NDU88_001239 [Pleurodeles waltl]